MERERQRDRETERERNREERERKRELGVDVNGGSKDMKGERKVYLPSLAFQAYYRIEDESFE